MKRIFVCADIEGTAGIVHWNETEKNLPDYAYFSAQMTREVRAACEGAYDAGAEEVLVKDAHDSARNLDPSALPEYARVFRGWAKHPFCMMYGLERDFDGVVFTGSHSPAGTDVNPLAHTMTTSVYRVTINGEIASELRINSWIAAYLGVPVYAVSGDAALCRWMKEKYPAVGVIPTNEGHGDGASCRHPAVVTREIRRTVAEAMAKPREQFLIALPEHFTVEIAYKEHKRAATCGFYPGAERVDANTVRYANDDYFEILRFMHFCL